MRINRRKFIRDASVGAAAAFVGPAWAAEAKRARALGLYPGKGQPKRGLDHERLLFNSGDPFEGVVRDNVGKPIAGITVTNGRDCVSTGEDGRYRLPPWPEARFISVTPPSGYVCTNWYYDAWNRFDRNFTLVWTGRFAKGGCRFVHIADSEIGDAVDGEAFVRNLKELGDREDVAFYVHTGDINGNRGMLAHHQLMSDYTMKRPTYYCLGNHDSVSTWPYGEAQFESLFGPCWHSFEVGGVHFLVTPMQHGGDRPGGYTEGDVARWIANDLARVPKDRPVIVFNHWLCNDGNDEKCGVVYGDGDFEIDLRRACNFRGWIYGHSHNHWFKRAGGVAFVNSSLPNKGGIDHSPNVARVVSVSAVGEVTSESFFGDYRGWKPNRAGAKWEVKLAAGVLHGGLVDGGDAIYVASNDDDGRGTGFLYALEKATGREIWKTKLANTVKGGFARAGGNLIGVDVEHVVHAYDETTGREAWTYDLCDEKVVLRYRSRMISHGAAASPDGTRVAVGVGYLLRMLDAKTGRPIWRHGREFMNEAVPLTPLFTDRYLVVPHNWGPVMCYEAATGKVVWKKAGFGFPGAQPCAAGDNVLLAVAGEIGEFELASGRKVQGSEAVGHRFACPGDMLVVDGMVLKGAVGEGLVALDRKDLRRRIWSAPVRPGRVSASEYKSPHEATLNTTPKLVDSETVVAGAVDGCIHFWNLPDGREKRVVDTGAPYLASVVASDGLVFAADLAGFVRAFDAGGGK